MHQSKDYMKIKLGLWRAQKCIPLVVAISALTCAGPQTTPSRGKQYRAENGMLGISGSLVQCLHQRKDYIKRKQGLWRAQKCIPLVGAISGLTSAGPQTTLTHIRQFKAENRIWGKSRATFRHGAVFAPKQGLYQNEASAM